MINQRSLCQTEHLNLAINKIKPQISIMKSAKSTRTTVHSSKRSSKSKPQQISKTADRKIRKRLNHDDSKSGGRKGDRGSKKSSERGCNNSNEISNGKYLITSPENAIGGVIKFFSLKSNSSRNPKDKGKFASVSTNRRGFKTKSSVLNTSKECNSGRLDISSKSQISKNVKQINFLPAPQSLRIKIEEESMLDENREPNKLQIKQKSHCKEE